MEMAHPLQPRPTWLHHYSPRPPQGELPLPFRPKGLLPGHLAIPAGSFPPAHFAVDGPVTNCLILFSS